MNSNKDKVIDYINNNFDISAFTIVDAPLVPGGVILTDKNGDKILLYWDILKQKVVYEFQ